MNTETKQPNKNLEQTLELFTTRFKSSIWMDSVQKIGISSTMMYDHFVGRISSLWIIKEYNNLAHILYTTLAIPIRICGYCYCDQYQIKYKVHLGWFVHCND